MTASMCPSLDRLGLLLQAAYRLREKHLAHHIDLGAIAKAELDLSRVHKLITHHRSSCRHCKYNEALRSLPGYNDSHSNLVSPNQVH